MSGEDLRKIIVDALGAEFCRVEDQSGAHAGHPGAMSGGGHFHAVVVSAGFRGLSQLERHRLVYGAVKMGQTPEIHALSLKTLTPEEWQK